MPTYQLKHGQMSGSKVDCGSITISQANNQTTVMANPPGGGAPTNITSLVTYTPKSGTTDTIMSPGAGDTLSLGSYTVTVNQVLYPFSTSATYVPPGGGKRGGYYTEPGVTGGQDDWDAVDSGK